MPVNIKDASLQFYELPFSLHLRHIRLAASVYSSALNLHGSPGVSPEDRRMSPEFVPRPPLSRSICKSLLMATLLTLAAPPVRAQSTSDASAATGYSVRGTVVNSITGQAVPHAMVTLSGDQATLTDGDGQFSFDNLTAGQYMVSVSKPGFLGFGNTGGSRGPHVMNGANLGQNTPPHRLQVGPAMPSVTFRIAPAGIIAGQVTLSTADPADGIHITLYRRQMHNGRPLWESAGETQSRSDGSFRLGGLPPGSYILATHASLDSPDPSTNSRLPVWGYPPVYYPGVTDPGSAGVLNLAAGQQAEADIAITRQQFFPVIAAVRSSEGESPANFEVLDSGGHTTGLPAHYDNREQLLHASVPNGSWILDGRAFGRHISFGRAEFLVASAPVSFAINVLEIPRIPVNIQREFTASSAATPNGPGVNLILASAEPFATGSVSGGMSPVPGSNGTAWAINLAEPGRFWVEAFPAGAVYVSSITSGGVDLASNPLIAAPGSSPSPVEITLRDDVGNIAGQLNADPSAASASAPAPGVSAQISIYAIPLFATAGPVPEGFLHSDGTFSISDVAPGSYRVIACDTPQQIDDHTPEGLAIWATKGQTVTVDPNSTAHVTLDVIHSETSP
jgi:Carboxypeptidase regulatory-like domain